MARFGGGGPQIHPEPIGRNTLKNCNPRYWKIQSQLIAITLVFGLCMVGWALYVNRSLERHEREQAIDAIRRIGERFLDRHQAISDEARQLLMTLSRTEIAHSLDPVKTSALLADIHRSLPQYSTLIVATPDGFVRACSVPAKLPIDIRERPWFRKTMTLKSFVADRYIISKSAGTASIPYAYPLLDDSGGVRLILGAALNLSFLERLFADIPTSYRAASYLLDEDGVVLYSRGAPRSQVGGKPFAMLPPALADAAPGVYDLHDADNRPMLYVVDRISIGPESNRFTLLVGLPKDDLFAEARRQLFANLTILAVLISLAAVLFLLYGRRMLSAPLQDLIRSARAVSDGHLDVRTNLSYNLAEFGPLAREIDAMIASLASEDGKRRQHARDLAASEERFRTLVEYAADAIYLADLRGRFLEVNIQSEQQTGYSRDEMLRMGIVDLDIEATAENLPIFLESMRQTKTATLTSQHRRKDGSTFPVEIRIVFLKAGDQEMVLGIARDISERREIEQQLKEAEQHYRTLANGGSALIWTSGLDMLCTYFNEPWLHFTGRRLEQELGNGWAEGVHPEDYDRCLATYVSAFEHRETFIMEYRLLHADGGYRWIRDEGNPRYDSNGEFLGYIGYCYDITESRRVSEDLVRKEALLQAMIRNLPFDFWARDLDLRVIMQSRESIRSWGDLLNHPEMEEKIDPQSHIDWVANNNRVLAGEIISGEREYRVASGERRIFHETIAPIRDGEQILGILGINIDITDRIRGEQERDRLRQQILQTQKLESIGRLAGGVAHDFNNMLGVILGHTELAMEQAEKDHQLQVDLREIRLAAQRSADLTRQLLAFARRQTAAPRMIDLNGIIEGMLKMLRRLIGEDIQLVWQPGTGLWPVKMDPSQIDQIIVNLCVNARDAIKDTGRITIATANVHLDASALSDGMAGGDFVELTIGDTGSGMRSEVLDNIFEPFFTTKDFGAGTGLGLSTVYGIIQQNHGTIRVDSTPGEGTVFRICLPRHADTLLAPPSEPAIERSQGRGETILLVEDEPLILALGKRMLESMGYRVIATSSPVEAIELTSDHHPPIDLLITDVVMPEMNGRELAERIRKTRPGLRCLFMSGYTADVIADRGVIEEGYLFIEKPFSKKELAARIREVFETN